MSVLGLIGTGLIGGSVALAARKYSVVDKVVGIDNDQSTIDRAIALGIVDSAIDDVSRLGAADLVCVAVPTHAIADCVLSTVSAVGESIPVFDVGSVKSAVLNKMNKVPRNFIPCHPISGSERQGPGASSPQLFDGVPVVITPVADSDPTIKEKINEFWIGVGANVYEQTPEEHDRDMALISHLPHMVAFVLMELLKESPEYLLERIGGSFRDMIRVAAADPVIWSNILSDNSTLITERLGEFKESLDRLSVLCQGDSKHLSLHIEKIREARLRMPMGHGKP